LKNESTGEVGLSYEMRTRLLSIVENKNEHETLVNLMFMMNKKVMDGFTDENSYENTLLHSKKLSKKLE